jgi:hypothetical protein
VIAAGGDGVCVAGTGAPLMCGGYSSAMAPPSLHVLRCAAGKGDDEAVGWQLALPWCRGGGVGRLALSYDCRTVAVVGTEDRRVVLVDLASGMAMHRLSPGATLHGGINTLCVGVLLSRRWGGLLC